MKVVSVSIYLVVLSSVPTSVIFLLALGGEKADKKQLKKGSIYFGVQSIMKGKTMMAGV